MANHPTDTVECGICTSPLLILVDGNTSLIACPKCQWLLPEDETSKLEVPLDNDQTKDHRTR